MASSDFPNEAAVFHEHDINLEASSWPKYARELAILPPLNVALDVSV